MNAPLPAVDALSRGFRNRYISYDELTSQLHAWAEAFPDVARVTSIGRSIDGRELWLLTLGPEPERARPAAWIDGNMHATELCGSSVALAIAEDVLRLHVEPDSALPELPEHVRARLREVLFHVLPRISPDGAEAVLNDGRYVRSNPRDRRALPPIARWIGGDIDGDGLSLVMRKVDPAGEFVESRDFPGLLLPRRLEDEGPFFKLYPEGEIEGFDGTTIPDPFFLSDNDTDLNRNFPWSWKPEPEQVGAGAFPTSEPEARAIVEFAVTHPNIFAWLNLHTFGGVYIRPLGNAPDTKMEPTDLSIFRQIGEWGETHGGYPTVSGFEEFTYEPDKPLHGDLTDFAYHQRGAIAYVCELWDLFRVIGMEKVKPFVHHYVQLTREHILALARWDKEHNASRILRPWKPVVHPQLGPVEVGGLDPRVGISNPPYEQIPTVCTRQSAAFLRVAAMAPALRIEVVTREALGADLHRVVVTVRNEGYLPSYVLASSKRLVWNGPLHAEARTEGCRLVAPEDARKEIGHLDGWGRGLFDESGSIFHQRSRGSCSSKTLSFTVEGRGSLVLRAGGHRTGWVEVRVAV